MVKGVELIRATVANSLIEEESFSLLLLMRGSYNVPHLWVDCGMIAQIPFLFGFFHVDHAVSEFRCTSSPPTVLGYMPFFILVSPHTSFCIRLKDGMCVRMAMGQVGDGGIFPLPALAKIPLLLSLIHI